MKKQLITYLIFSLILSSCIKNPNTAELEKYLQQNFNMEPQNGHIYLFVPSIQCHNCIMLNAAKLSPEINSKLHVFSALPQKHFLNFINYHHDEKENLLHLKLVDYENKIAFYNNEEIQFVFEANINPMQKTNTCGPR